MRFLLLMCLLVSSAHAENFTGAEDVYLQRAERVRLELARFWTGGDLPEWSVPCEMHVRLYASHVDSSGGGVTNFTFSNGEAYGWSTTLEGTHRRLMDTVIPHEVNHMVLATIKRRPTARWLDEGVAQFFEHENEHLRHRQLAAKYAHHPWSVARRFDAMNYPQNDMEAVIALYSTGFSFSEWLLEQGELNTFRRFVLERGKPSERLQRLYGMTVDQAIARWRPWVAQQNAPCAETTCWIHHHYVARPDVSNNSRPILYAVGTRGCIHCVPFLHAYANNKKFREDLNRRCAVLMVDGQQHLEWVHKIGIRVYPTYVLQVNGKCFLHHRYPGKRKLLAWIDETLITSANIPEDREPYRREEDEVAPPPPEDDPPTPNDPIEVNEDELETPFEPASEKESPTPNDPIEVNEKPEKKSTPKVPEPRPEVQEPKEEGSGIPWGTILLAAGTALGVGVPAWAVPAYKGVKRVRALRAALEKAHEESKDKARKVRAPTTTREDDNPPHDYTDDTGRYPGTRREHYVVDSPTPKPERRIDTQFVNIENDSYRVAHEEARQEIARRYPGSQEILEAELNLTRQFLAGQMPRTH